MRELTYADALREALREEMLRDPNVILLGEEIGIFNGVYKVTRGLLDEFGPDRVKDTPISEAAIAGAAGQRVADDVGGALIEQVGEAPANADVTELKEHVEVELLLIGQQDRAGLIGETVRPVEEA